jgi:hypothetical protein
LRWPESRGVESGCDRPDRGSRHTGEIGGPISAWAAVNTARPGCRVARGGSCPFRVRALPSVVGQELLAAGLDRGHLTAAALRPVASNGQ